MERPMTPREMRQFKNDRWDKNMDKISNRKESFVYPIKKEDLPKEVKNMVTEKIVTYRAFKELEGIGELKIELTVDDNFNDIFELDKVKLSGYAQLLIKDIIKKHEMG